MIWQMNGYAQETTGLIGNVGTSWDVARLGDYDGDGQGDILWRNPSSGANLIWEMNGLTKVASHRLDPVLGWLVP